MPILKVKKSDGGWLDILAIKGEKGEQGPIGLQGPEGPQGSIGPKGDPPKKYIDYWTQEDINDLDKTYIHKYEILISISETHPTNFSLGDRYLNTVDKRIYTAIDSEHWSDSSEPIMENVFYINKENEELYYYHNEEIINLYNILKEKLSSATYIGTCTDEELQEAIENSD